MIQKSAMRIAFAFACGLLLAGCGEEPNNEAVPIDCATGDAPHARDCTVERAGEVLILRKPDGGFRRLRVSADGIEAADGAEPARVAALEDGRTEIAIGRDVFLLPAEEL